MDVQGLYQGSSSNVGDLAWGFTLVFRRSFSTSQDNPIIVSSSLRSRWRLWLAAAVLLLTLGYGGVLMHPRSSNAQADSINQPGQLLMIEQRAWLGDRWIYFEVAHTTAEQAMGLMFRTDLSRDRGMVFPFDPPRPVRFWMRNVTISLDMLFVRSGEIIAISSDVPPCTTPTCPTYGPDHEIDHVIELAGGTAEQLGIAVGDRVEFEPIDPEPPSWVTTP
jgi:uncharacterized membrane protein (UPF0127 family)